MQIFEFETVHNLYKLTPKKFSFQINSSQTRQRAKRGIYFSGYFINGWDTWDTCALETKF